MDMRKVFKYAAIASGTLISTVVIAFFIVAWQDREMKAFQEVRASYKSSEGALLDRNGVLLHELRVDKNGRRLNWTPVGDISPALIKAVVLSEDKRFYSHSGVDWAAFASAARDRVFYGVTRGASTITMQLASMLENGGKGSSGRKSLRRKLGQIRDAMDLERRWSKDEILEAYLNLATFRGEMQGVSASSRGMFGKDPHGLDNREAVLLASLLRAPNSSHERLARRVFLLGKAVGADLSGEDALKFVRGAFSRPYAVGPGADLAPHLAVKLSAHAAAGQKVRTTLDSGLQRFAVEALVQQLMALKGRNVMDGAVLVVENRTGDVLAYVGSSAGLSEAPHVDGVAAKRQAGSTLKPLLYAHAVDRRLLTAATVIDDSPLDIPVANGDYRPRNYDDNFIGPVTARTALASSLNVPAVKTLQLVGVDNFTRLLQDAGISGLDEPGDFYGPSLALGSADVTLLELVNAYRTLANGGVRSGIRITPGEKMPAPKRVFSSEASFIISDILRDRAARSRTFGLESPLSTRFPASVKTGTSKDMRDNWCIGYSDKYTAGVWVGNFSGEPMWDVSGITGAAPVWVEIMHYLHGRGSQKDDRMAPKGLVLKKVDFAGIEHERQEWFIKGTEAERIRPAVKTAAGYRITYPVNGAVIALDPDIPAGQEKVFFEMDGRAKGVSWRLDGDEVGEGVSVGWTPVPGMHQLSIVDNWKRVLDAVSFEVKGGELEFFTNQNTNGRHMAR